MNANQAMYFTLLRALNAAIEILQAGRKEAEELYLNSSASDFHPAGQPDRQTPNAPAIEYKITPRPLRVTPASCDKADTNTPLGRPRSQR